MNTIIIDDEKEIRKGLRIFLKSYSFIQVVADASSVEEGRQKIEQLKPDLVFLGLHLKDSHGFEMLDQLKYHDFYLVLVTAHTDFAVKAFKYNAFDYLLKPLDSIELNNTICRLKNLSASDKKLVQPAENAEIMQRIVVKTSKEIFVIELEDIIRCEASQGYTYFHLSNGKNVLSSKTLKEYETLLPQSQFIRVHQSHFVNLNYVAKYTREGSITLKNGEIIPVSIRKRQVFLLHFNQFSIKQLFV
jgi:two-component system LytT family response regulator